LTSEIQWEEKEFTETKIQYVEKELTEMVQDVKPKKKNYNVC